jgi:hypothetical protein
MTRRSAPVVPNEAIRVLALYAVASLEGVGKIQFVAPPPDEFLDEFDEIFCDTERPRKFPPEVILKAIYLALMFVGSSSDLADAGLSTQEFIVFRDDAAD